MQVCQNSAGLFIIIESFNPMSCVLKSYSLFFITNKKILYSLILGWWKNCVLKSWELCSIIWVLYSDFFVFEITSSHFPPHLNPFPPFKQWKMYENKRLHSCKIRLFHWFSNTVQSFEKKCKKILLRFQNETDETYSKQKGAKCGHYWLLKVSWMVAFATCDPKNRDHSNF